MKREELLERIQELIQERENLTRRHEDLIKKDKLLREQLQQIINLLMNEDIQD